MARESRRPACLTTDYGLRITDYSFEGTITYAKGADDLIIYTLEWWEKFHDEERSAYGSPQPSGASAQHSGSMAHLNCSSRKLMAERYVRKRRVL